MLKIPDLLYIYSFMIFYIRLGPTACIMYIGFEALTQKSDTRDGTDTFPQTSLLDVS